MQKTALSVVIDQEQACSRITQLGVWVIVCLFVCRHAENGPIHRTIAVVCVLMITSKGETLFQIRSYQTISIMCAHHKKQGKIDQPVFSIVDTKSCLSFFLTISANYHYKFFCKLSSKTSFLQRTPQLLSKYL